MATPSIKEQLLSEIDKLSPEQQKKVLEFTYKLRSSSLPPGIPGEVLLERAREINFDPEDLAEIAAAIEEGCERIDWDGWEFPA